MEKETLDDIAGEYVLGTLSDEERRAAAERLKTDANFARLVHEWEERLSPLSETQEPVAAPLGIWHKISNRLEDQPVIERIPEVTNTNNNLDKVTKLVASRNRWRAAFVGAIALAASFIGLQAAGIYLPFLPKPAADGRFIAVLNPSGSTTGFVIKVDVGTKKLEIQRIANKAPTGKDYELWVIEPDKAAKSLNVVGRNAVQQVSYSNFDKANSGNQSLTFAITLEPEGGSPTGKATGPIVFSGQLITQ
jgi:anti-sigma-K factor RskA